MLYEFSQTITPHVEEQKLILRWKTTVTAGSLPGRGRIKLVFYFLFVV